MAPRHTTGNGVDPLAELHQGSQLSSTGDWLVIGKGRWGSIAVGSNPSRRWKTPSQNPGGSTCQLNKATTYGKENPDNTPTISTGVGRRANHPTQPDYRNQRLIEDKVYWIKHGDLPNSR